MRLWELARRVMPVWLAVVVVAVVLAGMILVTWFFWTESLPPFRYVEV